MCKSLNVLSVEGSEQDCLLIRQHLSAAGYIVSGERVDDATGLRNQLGVAEWDVILCDYAMPDFTALDALAILGETGLDIPFIIVSGTAGEEIAVEAMLSGADDYLSKDNLTRLIPAIERELDEAENRRLRRHAENERHAIFQIIQAAVVTPVLRKFLTLVHQSIGHILYAENCFIMLRDPAASSSYFELWADKYDLPPEPGSAEKGFAGYVIRTGKPLIVDDATRKTIHALGEAEQVGTRSASWLGVPLRTASGTIGVLAVQHYEIDNAYAARDLEFLSSVGDQVALAIERKRAEAALRQSEERYRDLVENAIDIIYVHDLNGNYTSVNRAAKRITGFSRDEILTMNMADSIAPEHLERAKQMVTAKLAGEDTTGYEIEVLAKDGGRVLVEVNTRLIYENGVPAGVQGIARDVTERKLLEDKLRQSQKLEAVGMLAGGIAHDFNNLLTAISGYSELTLAKMAPDDPLRHNIEEIKDAGARASRLTGQLLAFSRKQVLKPVVHNLNAVVTNLEHMLRRIIKESVEFRFVLEADLGNIEADPGQLEQVIVNLAINAQDAMPRGGMLTIRTENVVVDRTREETLHIKAEPGPFVKMTVSDTGEGIDEKVISRIFEPFFTTKATGKGSGLGLSTVHGIVTQSGGDIVVQSVPNSGTTFEIYLPLVSDRGKRRDGDVETQKDHRGTETILLAEDDEPVRDLVRAILIENGYEVLEAASGEAALSICKTYSRPIHILVSDLVMPGMSGTVLASRFKHVRPDAKILIMTGYVDDAAVSGGMLGPDIEVIEKPFTPAALVRAVREALGSAQTINSETKARYHQQT